MTIRLIICILATCFLAACAAEPEEFYVSPYGDDEGNGTIEDPYYSLDRARRAVLDRESEGPATVYLEGGTHYLFQTTYFKPEDSGTEEAPITYKALEGETPILSGGFPLYLRWQLYEKGVFVAALPEFARSIPFDQLFLNGERMHLARYPNYDAKARYFNGTAADAIEPSRTRRWENPIGGFVHALHKHEWGGYHYFIVGKRENGELTLEGGWQNNRQLGMHPEHRFVENIREELDAPGEWFIDFSTGLLYCYPPEGVDINSAAVEVVNLAHLIQIEGSPKNPVKHLRFEGLTFTHTARTFMDTQEPLLRSDWAIYRGGAMLIQGAEQVQVANCNFESVGGNAIFLNNYNREVEISGCRIVNAGASGICIVGDRYAVRSPSMEYHQYVPFSELDTQAGPLSENYPANCLIRDNLIHDIGRIEKQVAGVQIAMAAGITVSHNSIYNVPRAGINIGDGCWGGHVIEHNDVFNTVLETGDHGAFNSWGRDRFWHPTRETLDSIADHRPEIARWDAVEPTIIRNNRFRCDHGWDIDLDDGSSNYQIYNNLCLNGGIKLREGLFRTVENNIMVNNSFHPHVWFRESEDVFRRNIVSSAYKPIRLKGWGKEIDYNLFPDETALAQSTELGLDQHSRAGNPGFVDPGSGDFRVEENSPALELGFQNFEMDFGVESLELRAEAQEPEIPLLLGQLFLEEGLAAFEWLGATVKNVDTPGERSAAGLDAERGVWVLEASGLAKAGGLRSGDVILGCEGDAVNEVRDLLQAWQSHNWKGAMTLKVLRNQREQDIRIQAK